MSALPRRAIHALAVLCCAIAIPAQADTVRLYAAAALKAPVTELARAFEGTTGHQVALVFDTGGAAEERFLADPAAGILITTDSRVRDAERRGALKAGVSVRIGATVAGFAATPGLPRPPLSNTAELKATLLAARRIAFSDPARGATVGAHFARVIEQLGIREAVMAKATLARDGIETMRLVLAGDADLGITQISEIVQADRAALAGPFPPEFDLSSMYVLWRAAAAPPATTALAAALAAPAGRALLAEHGLRTP